MAPNANALKRSRGAVVADDDIEATGIPDSSVPKSKKARTENNNTLFVRSLPTNVTNESLAEFFSQHFPVKHAAVVLDPATKASRGFGFVTFTDAEDAQEAKSKFNNELWNGRRIVLDVAEARQRDEHGPGSKKTVAVPRGKTSKAEAIELAWKSPKLIIRNLPWSIKKPDQLAALFQSFGKIKFTDLPMNYGRLRGFGFVTIRGQKNAENAVAAINGKVIDGRTLAVDFAVDKDEWDQNQEEEEKGSPKDKKDKKDKKEKKEKTTADSAKKKKNEAETAKPKPAANDADAQLNADLENFLQNHLENLEEESDKDDEDEDESDKDSEDDDDDEEESEDEPSEAESEAEAEENSKPQRTTDNNSTVFIRNLPFTTTDEQLKTHFLRFGPVRYARVVMDRATDRPAGTGFVCFFNEDDSKACVVSAPKPAPAMLATKHSVLQDETADPEGKYTLDGRLLQVAQAVSKNDATQLAADGGARRRAGDKRRLFLLEEGQLDTRSPMYKALTPAEITMREQSRKQRKKHLESNPNLHISLTRLAVRNIPGNMGAKELKQLARDACVGFATDVKEGLRQPLSKEEKARARDEDKEAEHNRKLKRKGIVRQAKIEFESRDGAKVNETTGGKSRGYGFIEYSSHRWALMGLRWLNGHVMENEQGRKQRLIVEFAIENAQVVARRRTTEVKQNGPADTKTKDADNDKEDREAHKAEVAPSTAETKLSKAARAKSASNKSNKKFALKAGAAAKKAGKSDAAPPTPDEKRKPKPGEKAKEDVQQTLIARKRLMRKKKSQSRGGKA